MKITHNKVGQNLNVRENTKAEKSDKAGAAVDAKDLKAANVENNLGVEASKVNLSNRAQDIKRASEIANASPDINQEKVDRLQKMIDSGSYKTDAKEIAGKMVDEQLLWE